MTFLAFIAAISLLVTIHELGHYVVAKICRVKVLRFAVGFGRPIWVIKRGDTEWALCAIPLGGYVKLLDERMGSVKAQDKPFTFNAKPVGQRIAITIAGSLANLLVAMLLSFLVLLPGEEQMVPYIGTVIPQTPAARAGFEPGERIVAINANPVTHWQAAQQEVLQQNVTQPLRIKITQPSGVQIVRQITLTRFMHDSAPIIDLNKIGLYAERMLPIIGRIDQSGAAAKAGLKVGDQLRFIDNQPITNWQQFVAQIHNHPGQLFQFKILRNHRLLSVAVRVDTVNEQGFAVGKIGIAGTPDPIWYRHTLQWYRPTALAALQEAVWRTLNGSWMTLRMIGRMVVGEIAFSDHVVGPITIARLAGATAQLGWLTYLKFLALVSMSLGILNLLPIPMLDGGRLVYCIIELVRGRPVSYRIQVTCDRVGMLILYMLMFVGLFNDFNYLFAG